jgi:sterol desaturase/sphingolipid hydroxylase (fatty acid hydroxylase superfamily)
MAASSGRTLVSTWDRLVDSSWNYRIAMVADLLAPLGWLVFAARRLQGSPVAGAAWAVGGFFCFGFLEYAVHRWVLHGPFPVFRRSHARHHAHPLALYSAPLFVMMTVSLAIFGGLDLVLPTTTAALLVFGLYAGYDYFAVLHHLQHHSVDELGHVPYFHDLERFHDRHHHRPSVNFGITTTVWDRVFSTFERRV